VVDGAKLSLASTAARGAAISLVAQWVKFVIGIGSLAVLARLLDPEDFGIVTAVTAFTSAAYLLSDFGLSMAAIQSQSISQHQKSNLFWINVLLGLTAAGIVYMAAWPIAHFYGVPEVAHVTQAIAGLFLISAATAQYRAEASKRLLFSQMAIADILAPAVALVVGIWAAVAGLEYWALVLQQVTQALVLFVVLIAVTRWVPSLPRRGQQMKSLLSFGVNSVGVQLVNYVSNNIDSVILGRVSGVVAVGFYSRAYQIYRLPLQQLAAPTTRVAFPILSKLNDDQKTFDRYLQRGQLILAYVLGGAFFAGAGLANPLIEIVLGPHWDLTKILFAILCVGGLFQAMGYVYYWLFLAKAMTGLQLKWSLISRALMVALIIAGSFWGAVGVASGVSAGLVLNWVILTVFAVPRTGTAVRPLVMAALRPILVFTLMLVVSAPAIILTSMWSSSWGQLGTIGGIMVAYLGVVFWLSQSVRTDVLLIVQTVKRLRH